MIFTPSDIATLRAEAQGLKDRTNNVLSSTNRQEASGHRDACTELSMQMEHLDSYWADLIEQKRRDLADARQERNMDALLRKELKEHARRANNSYWELKDNRPMEGTINIPSPENV